MKIICLVKFVPDLDKIQFDKKKNVLMRENARLSINPDDETALAASLKLKEKYPETVIEILSMGPKSVARKFQDLLRRNVDKGILISDPLYVGSDTFATSRILTAYLKRQKVDWIFTGTHSLDGDTSHVPAQIAELLQMDHLNNVVNFDREKLMEGTALLRVDCEGQILEFRMDRPGILSFEKSREFKMPYIRYEDFQRDVSDQLEILTNKDLQLSEKEVGLSGSMTEVSRTFIKELVNKESITVKTDDEGIERVYEFLKEKDYI